MTLSAAQPKYTAPKEAVELYAGYLKGLTLCVDYSIHPPSLFFANTRKPASVYTISAKFSKWSRDNKVWIEDYVEFCEKLTSRVMARLPHVYGAAFKPVDEAFFDLREGITVANTFVPFLPPPVPPAPAELMEYFERLFPNDADRKHVLQFYGHAFQFPLIRPSHALLVTGEQGNGKSTLPTILRKAMGGNHVFDDNSYSSAFTTFSSMLPDNMFGFFDDAKADRHTHGRLKVEITRKQQSVNVKFQQHPEDRNVYTRLAVLSNSHTPMQMDNCRRFYATEFATHTNKHNPEGTKANTDAFFDRFFEWLDKPESAAQLRQFFLSVDLDGFNAFSIPQTPTLLGMIENGRSALGKLVEAYVEDLPCFHMNQLYKHLKANNIPSPNLDAITAVLDGLGYKSKRRVVEGCGDKQIDVWTPPAPAGKKQTRSCTPDEALEIAASVGAIF
jgi:hypothetical protein